MIEDRPDGLGFRHELARRAIESSLPVTRVRLLNRAVVEALRLQERPERARLMHHAVAAGDVDTVLAIGPQAAREAARAGAHRQALAHLEAVVPYAARLAPAEQAAVLDDYGWELYNAARFREAVRAGSAAAELYAGLGDSVALGSCLVRVSRHWFMAGETDAAEECAERAVRILEAAGDDAALAQATLYQGAILALAEDPEQAAAVLRRADDLARASQRMDLAVLCLNYIGIARVERGDPEGLEQVRESIGLAIAGGHHEAAARGYTNLAELLLRAGRLDELERCVTDGLAFTHERGFWSHAYNLDVHRCLLLLRTGDWDGAEQGLRGVVDAVDDPGMLFAYSVPWLGRLLARRGDPVAEGMLAAAWEQAQRHRLLLGLAYAGIARVEWAWLAGRPEIAERVAAVLLAAHRHPGAAPFRGELLRYLARAGLPAESFDGCPPAWAAGHRGRLARGGGGVAGGRRPLRGGARAGRVRRGRRHRRGAAHPGGPARRARRRARARAPARDGRAGPARAAGGHARQPGRPDAAPARRARAAARGHDERRDRRPPRPLGPHGRPPRGGRPGQARRAVAARGRGRGAGARGRGLVASLGRPLGACGAARRLNSIIEGEGGGGGRGARRRPRARASSDAIRACFVTPLRLPRGGGLLRPGLSVSRAPTPPVRGGRCCETHAKCAGTPRPRDPSPAPGHPLPR